MEFKDVVLGRRSIRGYLSKPVPQDVITDILQTATRAASANNIQPWNFAVVTGAPLEELKKENLRRFKEGSVEDYADAPATQDLFRNRSRELGKELFHLMDIAREDKEKRAKWMERGFGFFDAPVVILLYLDGRLDEGAFRFDLGCVAQNICLAAYEKGLGTCIENQAINYHNHYYKALNIPAYSKFVVGISLGYPDPDFPANKLYSKRADLSENTTWIGF